MVVTTLDVKNISTGPIARLTVEEIWYDKGGEVIGGGRGVINGVLPAGKVQTITIQTPFNARFNANNYKFTHANGAVEPKRVDKMVDPDAEVWELAQLALSSGAEVLGAVQGEALVVSALPLEAAQGAELGAVILCSRQPPVASPSLIEALRAVATRFAGELAWRASHERLIAESERLRQSSILDPLLAVWTRAALEHALPGEVAAAQ